MTAGDGLRGVAGIQGWYRDAVADFVRHSAAEGRDNESVGVFLIEPAGVVPVKGHPKVSFMREVAWRARYLALENEAVAAGLGKRSFSVSPEQIEKVWKEAEARQNAFFDALKDVPLTGKRYHPLMGIGHSHPNGAAWLSKEDRAAFAAWAKMLGQLTELDPSRLTADGHFVYVFGGLTDTLLAFDASGNQTVSAQGNFLSAVQ